mmetsp:Transcript_4406/g.6750  ORF Transcript_4406/g.6750 Transcript_4406/m.6750 type:complete len:266 (+) Transcript_4406:371-1168(+)
MPESGHSIRCDEASTRSHVNVAREPVGRLLVPRRRQNLERWCSLKLHNVHIVGIFPAKRCTVSIKSLKPRVPNIVRALRILPCKVILLAHKKQRYPSVCIALEPRLLQKGGSQNHRKRILRIIRVQQWKHAAPDDEDAHTEQRGQKGFERRPHIARNVTLRLAIGTVQQSSIARIQVSFVFVRRSSECGGETKGVSEVLEQVGEFLNGKWSAFLSGAVFLTLGKQISIVKIVAQGIEFDGQDHLRTCEVHVVSEVVDELAVEMAG